MRNLVVSLLIIAAMMMGAVVGMAPFLKAAMTEPILDGLECSSPNPCSNPFEFKLAIPTIIDKTITAAKADATLRVEILGFASKWDVDKADKFINVMLAVKIRYVQAGISKDRIVLAWANKWPKVAALYKATDELQAAEIHRETGNTIDNLAEIAREVVDGLTVSDEQKKALFDKFLKANRKALLVSEVDGKYQMEDDGIYVRLIK